MEVGKTYRSCLYQVSRSMTNSGHLYDVQGQKIGHPAVTQLGRQYDVQHLNVGLGNFLGHHVDVYDRVRKFT